MTPRKEAFARYEHGRWLIDCPNCNGAELYKPDTDFVCGTCYPDAFSMTSRPGPIDPKTKKQTVYPMPDEMRRIEARARAAKEGNAFRVVFVLPKEEVEKRLAHRPNPNKRNWFPRETLKDLEAENLEHGLAAKGNN